MFFTKGWNPVVAEIADAEKMMTTPSPNSLHSGYQKTMSKPDSGEYDLLES